MQLLFESRFLLNGHTASADIAQPVGEAAIAPAIGPAD